MNLNTFFKKEGIENIKKLDILSINSIAKNVSNKLCSTFYNHNLNESSLFSSIASLDMYTAEMPNDLSCAKYVFDYNCILFSDNLSLSEMCDLAIHECIHYLQEFKDSKGNVTKLGLYKLNHKGLAINEASVQLMSALSSKKNNESVKYYDISFNTISPNYYPLLCCLLNQITYFTGDYCLHHSTIYSDSLFQDTFIAKTNKKVYTRIINCFEELLKYEEELNFYISELQYTTSKRETKYLSKIVKIYKEKIAEWFFYTQNLIMQSFFNNIFDNIKTVDELTLYKNKLYNYKDFIGYNDSYSFYNEFYCKCMAKIENKKMELEAIQESASNSLVIYKKQSSVSIIFSKLFKLNKYNSKKSILN